MNEKTKSKVQIAAELGAAAFAAGKPSVPALDPALKALLVGNRIGEGMEILTAWTQAWHKANVAQPFDFLP